MSDPAPSAVAATETPETNALRLVLAADDSSTPNEQIEILFTQFSYLERRLAKVMEERDALREALQPLKDIADAFIDNGLDEARPEWGDDTANAIASTPAVQNEDTARIDAIIKHKLTVTWNDLRNGFVIQRKGQVVGNIAHGELRSAIDRARSKGREE